MKKITVNFTKAVACLLGAAFFLSASSEIFAYEQDQSYKLRVLFFNDTHGRFWKNSRNEGGFSAITALVKDLRSEGLDQGMQTMLLHAGDFSTGIPESDLQDAEPDIVGFNLMKVDLAVLGNHEFDKPLAALERQMGWARFPILSSNIYYESNDKPVYQQYALRSYDGLKIAVFGLTTEDTPLLTNPDNHRGRYFKPAVKEASNIVPKLKEKVDFIIALTHIGFYPGGNYGTSAPGDIQLAREVEGINLIVGGHSHTTLEEPVSENGSIIVHAGSYSKYLGQVDLEFKNGKTTVLNYKLHPINLTRKEKVGDKEERVLIEEQIIEDPTSLAVLGKYQQAGQDKINIKVGYAEGLFVGEREVVRSSETNLGNLISEVQANAANADIGIANSGGIRSNLPEGDITFRDILTVQPFGNTVVSAVLSGQELIDYLTVAASKTPGSGGYPQFYGVKFKLKDGKIQDLNVQGKPVNLNGSYKIATNNFIANGGDGYTPITDLPSYVDTGLVDAGLLRNFFEEKEVVSAADYAPEGRFVRE